LTRTRPKACSRSVASAPHTSHLAPARRNTAARNSRTASFRLDQLRHPPHLRGRDRALGLQCRVDCLDQAPLGVEIRPNLPQRLLRQDRAHRPPPVRAANSRPTEPLEKPNRAAISAIVSPSRLAASILRRVPHPRPPRSAESLPHHRQEPVLPDSAGGLAPSAPLHNVATKPSLPEVPQAC
jgi:hypothetical protein